MGILQVRTVKIEGVYADGVTFSKLLLSAIKEELTEYGFVCEMNETNSGMRILWNSKYRLWIEAKTSTTHITMRYALPYGDQSNWGSTFQLAEIDSASTEAQTFSFDLKFFAFDDIAYMDICNPDSIYMSVPAYSIDGTSTVVGVRVNNNSNATTWAVQLVCPFAETAMDNNWSVALPYLGYGAYPTDPARSIVASTALFIHNSNNVEYITESLSYVGHSTSFDVGQVITIDGERYVYLHKGIFAKIS